MTPTRMTTHLSHSCGAPAFDSPFMLFAGTFRSTWPSLQGNIIPSDLPRSFAEDPKESHNPSRLLPRESWQSRKRQALSEKVLIRPLGP